jgi:hypothetical protein
MEHGAYEQKPFGPFASDDKDDRIARAGGIPIDIRGASDWKGILRVDTAQFEWGQLVITAEASAQPSRASDLENGFNWLDADHFPWAEVRVLVTIGGIDHVWFQGGAGNHSEGAVGGNDKSPGPILLPFLLGEVPDAIDVQARAMRGGLVAGAGFFDDEILTVTAVTRFRR